jgi:hypothetical protein
MMRNGLNKCWLEPLVWCALPITQGIAYGPLVHAVRKHAQNMRSDHLFEVPRSKLKGEASHAGEEIGILVQTKMRARRSLPTHCPLGEFFIHVAHPSSFTNQQRSQEPEAGNKPQTPIRRLRYNKQRKAKVTTPNCDTCFSVVTWKGVVQKIYRQCN